MHLSFQITAKNQRDFLDHWSSKYDYPAEPKYTRNIGKSLTAKARQELFEWKNGSLISKKKTASIHANYPLVVTGDLCARYLNHKKPGGAIWNIFYLHCLDPKTWPIFDQHTYRAMKYLQTGQIQDKALFAFGQFLKLAKSYA